MSNPFSRKPVWGQMETAAVTPMPTLKQMGTPVGNVDDKKTVMKFIVPLAIVFGCLAAVAIIAIIILVVKSRFKKAASSKPTKVYTPGAKVKEIEQELKLYLSSDNSRPLLPEDVQTPPSAPHETRPFKSTVIQVEQEEHDTSDLEDVLQVAKSLGISEPKRIPAIKVMMAKYGTDMPEVKISIPSKSETSVEKPVQLLSYRELQDDYEKKKKKITPTQEIKKPVEYSNHPDKKEQPKDMPEHHADMADQKLPVFDAMKSEISNHSEQKVEETKPEKDEQQDVEATASYLSTLVTHIIDQEAEIGVVEDKSESSEGEPSDLEEAKNISFGSQLNETRKD